jgi:protein ImuB
MTVAPRIACLYVPDFRLQVHLRALGGDPEGGLALVDPADGRRLIVAASANARLDGVRRGMPAITAAALAQELMVREVDALALSRAERALSESVRSCCPVFESTGMGVIYAAWAGLERRYEEDGEGGLLDDLRDAAVRLGLPARTGMAGTRFAARAAAILQGQHPNWGRAAILVPPGQERSFLAPLPLELLPDAGDLLEGLRSLGLTTLGDLAALPAEGVARRYGPKGVQFQRLARGEDRAVLIPTPEPRRFVHRAFADGPIVQTEALRALVQPLVGGLCEEIDAAGLAARGIRWTLTLEGGGRGHGRTVSAAPSAAPRLWNELLGIAWDNWPMAAPLVAVELEAEELGPRPVRQEPLVGGVQAPPGALGITLAHLHAELGDGAIGSPQLRDRPEPIEREELRAFDEGDERRAGDLWVADRRGRGALRPACRRLDPPEPIEVDLQDERPIRLRTRRGPQVVQRLLGPWDTSGGWWEEGGGWRHRLFQVELAGGTAWIGLEPAEGRWTLEAWMD